MLTLIVDDHALIRDALRGLLGSFENVNGIIEAATATEAEKLLKETPGIGLVLVDLSLPDRDGLTLLTWIRSAHPGISVVMLSASEDRVDMRAALECGAAGFIPKSATRDVMKGALKLIFSGGIYVPPEILARSATSSSMPRPPSALSASARLDLTGRQEEVLQLMMQGMSNKAICRVLDIAEPTVKNHVTAILRALGAANRTEAVIAATSHGLTAGDES